MRRADKIRPRNAEIRFEVLRFDVEHILAERDVQNRGCRYPAIILVCAIVRDFTVKISIIQIR